MYGTSKFGLTRLKSDTVDLWDVLRMIVMFANRDKEGSLISLKRTKNDWCCLITSVAAVAKVATFHLFYVLIHR